MLDSYVTTSTFVCRGEGVGGRALKFLIMGNFKGGEGYGKSGECLDCLSLDTYRCFLTLLPLRKTRI